MTDEINPGYALGQLARALLTSGSHEDAETRARAAERAARWQKVLAGMADGNLHVGSRTPVAGAPAWATLEVVKGGFATGNLLAGGDLQPHELQWIEEKQLPRSRAALQAWFLSDAGLFELSALLESGCYRIVFPEQGALLVVAWLAQHQQAERAQQILDEILPFFDRLQFLPVPSARPLSPSAVVHLRTVKETLGDLEKVKTPDQVQRMNEALTIWLPLTDRLVALFRETVADGWPCKHYPDGWNERARQILDDYHRLRAAHPLCTKVDKPRENFARLRGYLQRILVDPRSLTGRDVGMIRSILSSVKVPPELREKQARDAARPTSKQLSDELSSRLREHPGDEGLPSLEPVIGERQFPRQLIRKLLRCLEAPIDVLVEKRVITSSETIARVLPQLTSQVAAAGIADAQLRLLRGAIYAAFRRRRGLLLLHLQHQVRLEELPWIAAIEPFRKQGLDAQARARQTLEELVALALVSFPFAILPNKLLQEITAMAQAAKLELPLVEEVAADIFMGTFSAKYLRAAQVAARVLDGSIYERYYGLPFARVLQMEAGEKKWGVAVAPAFVELCTELAGPRGDSKSHVAYNGTIIEQEQLLTTHNLAVLCDALKLPLPFLSLAQDCFVWVCARQQQTGGHWKAKLQMLKNTAYAWRQMLFFLSLAPERDGFVGFAREHFAKQRPAFRERFAPALRGLLHVLGDGEPGRRFLGWTTERHWLMPPK